MSISKDAQLSQGKRKLLKLLLLGALLGLLVSIALTILRVNTPQPRSKLYRHMQLGEPAVRIPFQLVNGLPVVKVMVNGQGPYRFVLDTGAQITCIQRNLKRKWVLVK